IGVVEMREPIDVPVAQDIALANGVWLRPFGKLLYTMPPYIINDDDLRKITTTMRAIAQLDTQ
ncbi:MAG: aminotransferase class III-fold pyridoxal phosphate-dependent enzyme, partial [Lentisphaeria bacterium]|nr:aminotransferase class III-fold pyridoxal phosphate-dependent enzyme [Lentisphaeria bacterium]